MRLDHLLSREYEEYLSVNHGQGGAYEAKIPLYSFEGARERTFKRAQGERPGHRGGVAQLGEHLLCKQGVIGSNPFISTNFFNREVGAESAKVDFCGGSGRGETRMGS